MKRPKTGVCPVCGSEFEHKQRVQGGGARQIYCSPKCRSLDWVHGNAKKRQAAVIAYDAKPENKAAKTLRAKHHRAAKLGWSLSALESQLDRQDHKCYGCLSPINEATACIDHDHETGRIRGLLCKHCNWGLGHLRDNQMVLRRLGAYLDYRIEKRCVYLIGALKNPRIPEVGNILRARGLDVMDEWFTPGEFADTNWQAYEALRGRTYAEALKGRAATNIAMFDRAYLDLSDVVILLAPAGKSAMLELGYAKGRNKTVYVCLDGNEPDRYDVMPNLVDAVFNTVDDLVRAL